MIIQVGFQLWEGHTVTVTVDRVAVLTRIVVRILVVVAAVRIFVDVRYVVDTGTLLVSLVT